jgi:DNA-binding XRE family transcriptional regulator
MVACHNDGNTSNNNVDNLRWDTPAGNAADTERHGTRRHGSQMHNAKLNEEMVRRIRELRTTGLTQDEIAGMLGVTQTTVGDAERGRKWGHVRTEDIPSAPRVVRRGSSNVNAKLREEDIPRIKFLFSLGDSAASIARSYGVSDTIIFGVVSGKSWRHAQ